MSGPFATEGLEQFDIIAVSPGLRPDVELKEILPFAKEHGIPVWSEIEMFAQALKGLEEGTAYKPDVIAVTGTNGKTTVTSLTGHMCERAGKTVRLAGQYQPRRLWTFCWMSLKKNSCLTYGFWNCPASSCLRHIPCRPMRQPY